GADLMVGAGRRIGRVERHGSATLYRPSAATPLEHRLLEVDPGGIVTTAFDRDAQGNLRGAWVSLVDGGLVGLLPGGAQHPLWGASDSLMRLAGPRPLQSHTH